eukprot:4099344-Pleurochrysis_carterae.AAC.1
MTSRVRARAHTHRVPRAQMHKREQRQQLGRSEDDESVDRAGGKQSAAQTLRRDEGSADKRELYLPKPASSKPLCTQLRRFSRGVRCVCASAPARAHAQVRVRAFSIASVQHGARACARTSACVRVRERVRCGAAVVVPAAGWRRKARTR